MPEPNQQATSLVPAKPAKETHDILKDLSLVGTTASLHGLGLQQIQPSLYASLHGITSLDLSQNQLAELPGLECLSSLVELSLSRNWFRSLPRTLAKLGKLVKLDASRNFLRPNEDSLGLSDLAKLPSLAIVDLRFNQKLCQQKHLDYVTNGLSKNVTVHVTVSFPAPVGDFVGANPRDRDATLLRSQLEPWPTVTLRQRLVQDFGQTPTDPYEVGRGEVMRRLLECYAASTRTRTVHRMNGSPVSAPLLAELLEVVQEWARTHRKNRQQRPSIAATSYMILRSPSEFSQKTSASKKAQRAAAKFERHARLWGLAAAALKEVDPDFAAKFTALAVTHHFTGSPHIDKQNIGPFYGLALGDFPEGQGGICVECDAWNVAHVNTRNRLAKVDGRFPHWVAPYDTGFQRYSLIYYQTEGEPTPQTTATFPPK